MNKKKGCLVTNRIIKDGKKIGYMYREQPYDMFDDSGWRFFSGDEDEEYIKEAENSTIHTIEEILKIDESIKEYLDAPCGSSYYKEKGKFVEEYNGDDY